MNPAKLLAPLTTTVVSLALLAACGKSVTTTSGPAENLPSDTTQTNSCDVAHQLHWSFTQPPATTRHSVDLLFVADTSDSLLDKRARIARAVPTFLGELPAGTDYRVGVMLAHGPGSKHSGQLYAPSGIPKVLSSATLSTPRIQSYLSQTLSNVVADVDEANGEMLLSSLLRSLEPARRAAIQAQGFYRANTALSVVFITDENDICFRPDLHGYENFPDFVPSAGGTEVAAYNKYCVNPDGTGRATPAEALSALLAFKGSMPLSLAAIIHADPTLVPHGASDEDSIGHGVLELVDSTPHPVTLDIMQHSYSDGLKQLGTAVSTQLRLNTSFVLANAQGVDPESIMTQVDGTPVGSSYDGGSSTVQISPAQAGSAGSRVDVTACRL